MTDQISATTAPGVLLLTGEIHIGKTTVCRSVIAAAQHRGWRVAGLLSPTVLDSVGERVAVEMIDLSTNRTRTLARLDRKLNGPRLGPYHFDARTLTWGHNVVARAIARGCDLLVIDEIGRLELEQDAGLDVVPLLASNALPLSVFVVRSPLLQLFHQKLPGVATMQFEITLDNRAAASAQVARLLGLP
ncbi:MAG TPA: nucleoside-triphosphatase [Anaerolineae bacterium]|nr:nucleoside-triphosphatase [Anaerolineae bacterium]